MTTEQPILQELHAVREQMLADAGGSLADLVKKLQEDQAKSGREIRKPRITMQRTKATESGDAAGDQ